MKRNILSILALVGFISVSGQAVAEDGHSYNGSFCKPRYGNQSADFRYDYNGIYNASSAYRWVNCPIIEDAINADNNAATQGTTRAYLRFTAATTSSRIRCYLYSNKSGGASWLQWVYSTRLGSGWLDIDPTPISKDHYWGDYGMYCYVPGRSKINMIWFGEKS